MDPEDRRLLERTFKLSENNSRILKKLERRSRWAFIWGVIKIAIVIVPLILGYLFIRPHLDEAAGQFQEIKEVFEDYRSLPF